MRIVLRTLGFIAIGLAVIAVFLAIAAWPPGGLFFAAFYFLLLIAAVLGLIGGVLVWLTRFRRGRNPGEGEA